MFFSVHSVYTTFNKRSKKFDKRLHRRRKAKSELVFTGVPVYLGFVDGDASHCATMPPSERAADYVPKRTFEMPFNGREIPPQIAPFPRGIQDPI